MPPPQLSIWDGFDIREDGEAPEGGMDIYELGGNVKVASDHATDGSYCEFGLFDSGTNLIKALIETNFPSVSRRTELDYGSMYSRP